MEDKCQCDQPGHCTLFDVVMPRKSWMRCKRNHPLQKFLLGKGPKPMRRPASTSRPLRRQDRPENAKSMLKRARAWMTHMGVPEEKYLDCAILFGGPPKDG